MEDLEGKKTLKIIVNQDLVFDTTRKGLTHFYGEICLKMKEEGTETISRQCYFHWETVSRN